MRRLASISIALLIVMLMIPSSAAAGISGATLKCYSNIAGNFTNDESIVYTLYRTTATGNVQTSISESFDGVAQFSNVPSGNYIIMATDPNGFEISGNSSIYVSVSGFNTVSYYSSPDSAKKIIPFFTFNKTVNGSVSVTGKTNTTTSQKNPSNTSSSSSSSNSSNSSTSSNSSNQSSSSSSTSTSSSSSSTTTTTTTNPQGQTSTTTTTTTQQNSVKGNYSFTVTVNSGTTTNPDGTVNTENTTKPVDPPKGGFSYKIYYLSPSGTYVYWKTATSVTGSPEITINGCGPGKYFVKPDPQEGYATTTFTEGVYVEITSKGSVTYTYNGKPYQGIDFNYTKASSFSVGAFYDPNNTGKYTNNLELVGGGKYSLYAYSGGSYSKFVCSATASSSGFATFKNVPYGKYCIVAKEKNGSLKLTGSSYVEVNVTASGCVYKNAKGKKVGSCCFGYR